MNKTTYLAIAIVIMMILVAGCSQTPAGEVVKERTIKIGILTPLTGPNPFCGEDMSIGFESALEELKKDYPDVNIKLIYEDTQFGPRIALTGAQKLINEDKVKVILGACSSSSTLAVAPIAEDSKIVLLTPTSFGEKITQAGDYIFRLAPTPREMTPTIAYFIYNDLGYKEIGMIYLNNDYGVTFSQRLISEYEKLRGKVLVNEGSEVSETDFKTTLLKMKNKGIELVFIAHSSRPGANFMRQAEELGLSFVYITTNALEREHFWKAVGELAEGIYLTSLIEYTQDISKMNPEKQRFLKQLAEKYPGRETNTIRANSYDALRLVAKIMIEKCGENPECIKEELYRVENYEGAVGVFSIDKNGDAIHESIYINVRKDNKLVLYK